MSDTTRAAQMGGNLHRAVQALWLAIDEGPGHVITIARLPDGSLEVVATAQGQGKSANAKAALIRTGRGATLTDALLNLAGKMGLSLPRGEG